MKKGDTRYNQILSCAEKLFYQKGFENTSVQDILDQLHLSKGGFYHHFESKLQVLTAITEQRTLARREEIIHAVTECSDGPLEQLNLLLEKSLPWHSDNPDFVSLILRVGYRDNSLQISESVKRLLLDTVRPLINGIIQEGYAQQVFYTRFPDDIGELLLMMYANINEEIALELSGSLQGDINIMRLMDRLEVCRYSMEMLLGAPYGSIRLFDTASLPEILRQLAARDKRLA